jgi:hypothetical protein
MKQRGIFEKHPGSGVWWICYFDQFGKKRREKAGTKTVATKLYGKRKQQVLEGKKLPENLRKPSVKFNQLLDDALAYSKRKSGLTRLTSLALPAWMTGSVRIPQKSWLLKKLRMLSRARRTRKSGRPRHLITTGR